MGNSSDHKPDGQIYTCFHRFIGFGNPLLWTTSASLIVPAPPRLGHRSKSAHIYAQAGIKGRHMSQNEIQDLVDVYQYAWDADSHSVPWER